METYLYKRGERLPFEKAVIALGLFDGVHKGHRAVICAAKEKAREKKLPLAVFTFFAETEELKGGNRLYSSTDKARLFSELGVEKLIFADFSELSSVCAENFISKILIGDMGCDTAVAGEDFRFGKNAEGNISLLRELMKKSGGDCVAVEPVVDGGVKISTSLIKEKLRQGKPKEAAMLLGKPYFISGTVLCGNGVGHTLGSPTVNTSLQSQANFIKKGVYFTKVKIDGKFYTGVTNIGNCPTFRERETHAETHVFGISGSLYGKDIDIYLIEYLREEKTFQSPSELVRQIEADKETAKKMGENLKWQEIGIN